MKIELIEGTYSREDSLELITELIATKIKFHEKRIILSDQLEDIQFREKKIKKLSDTLKQVRTESMSNNRMNLSCNLNIDIIE